MFAFCLPIPTTAAYYGSTPACCYSLSEKHILPEVMHKEGSIVTVQIEKNAREMLQVIICGQCIRLSPSLNQKILNIRFHEKAGSGGQRDVRRCTPPTQRSTNTSLPPLPPPVQCMASNYFLLGSLGILAACTIKLGIPAMFNLYFMPYWFFVLWLDVVTYLQHHGSSDPEEKLPWFRGEVRGAAPISAQERER